MKRNILIAAGIVVLFFMLYQAIKFQYNRLVTLDQLTREAWSQVENVLQRRNDLIPNLVATVKGYAKHEREVFLEVTRMRSQLLGAKTIGEKAAASDQLSGALGRLLLVVENYPQLKASDNFRDLQVALEGTENRIAVARTRYNEAARQLNSYSKEFFGSFFCRRAGVKPVEYFEATEQAKTEVPKVKF